MISRMTTSTMVRSAQRNLQTSMVQLATLQEQATSLKAISRPSDNPAAAADALAVRAQQRAVEQYSRNADNGDGWLTTIDAALTASNAIMLNIRDLTVRGANDGSLSQSAREAIAKELTGLKEDLLKRANTTFLGRTVFAGNSDAGFAFGPGPGYAFTGAPGDTVQRRIAENGTVRVDADGSAVFGAGANSVFALVDTIADKLRNPNPDPNGADNIGVHLGELDTHMKAIRSEHAHIGAQQNLVDRAQKSLLAQKGTLEAQRSGIEDLDLGQVILDLKTQEVSYQAALAVTARTLQPTLMDFLR